MIMMCVKSCLCLGGHITFHLGLAKGHGQPNHVNYCHDGFSMRPSLTHEAFTHTFLKAVDEVEHLNLILPTLTYLLSSLVPSLSSTYLTWTTRT
ncbi:hypothetical protein DFH27DRAFT_277082 [Peziza echinospora]|nr:hypothetical protein DFH27DRAFT_277082 [Peziza echinospora]